MLIRQRRMLRQTWNDEHPERMLRQRKFLDLMRYGRSGDAGLSQAPVIGARGLRLRSPLSSMVD